MKKYLLLTLLLILAACNTANKYTDFDYSYSRSGGLAPIYENFYIEGDKARYSFEGRGKKLNKSFKVTAEELALLQRTVADNNFRMIREDHKKLYDNITTSINVKRGDFSGIKSDASTIMEGDRERWEKVVAVFRGIIDKNVPAVK